MIGIWDSQPRRPGQSYHTHQMMRLGLARKEEEERRGIFFTPAIVARQKGQVTGCSVGAVQGSVGQCGAVRGQCRAVQSSAGAVRGQRRGSAGSMGAVQAAWGSAGQCEECGGRLQCGGSVRAGVVLQ